MSTNKTFLVLYSTGNQGQAVVKTLAAHAESNHLQYKILAASRDKTSANSQALGSIKGVVPIIATAQETDTIVDAVRTHGPVDGAFLMTPPGVEEETADCIMATNIFKDLGVKHLIYSGADLGGQSKTPLENVEKKRPVIEHVLSLDSPSFRTTVLGPVMLMDNFVTAGRVFLPSILSIWKSGHKRKFVAASDIGRVAAICLTDKTKYGGMTINLAGDEPTPEEFAAAFREVKGIELPVGETPQIPPFLKTNFEWYNEHIASANVAKCMEMFPGMTDFRTFLATQYK